MGYKIIFTPTSYESLRGILEYLSLYIEDVQANEIVHNIYKRVMSLSTFPDRLILDGRIDLNDLLKEMLK